MTEPKIADLLENFGIAISSGQLSAWLTGAYPGIQEEKQTIVEAGLASSLTVPLYGDSAPWQHMDDTGTRVDGANHHARSCVIRCTGLVSPPRAKGSASSAALPAPGTSRAEVR